MKKVVSLKVDRKEKRKFKLLYYLVTSKYIILDDFSRIVSVMNVRKGQEVCQLWHGAGAFKKFGYSRQDKDYVLLNKPVIYFAYDYEEYQQDRGLYFEFDHYIYGEIAKDTEELVKTIQKPNLMENKRQTFIQQFMDACDGTATQKTCEWIFEKHPEFIISEN